MGAFSGKIYIKKNKRKERKRDEQGAQQTQASAFHDHLWDKNAFP